MSSTASPPAEYGYSPDPRSKALSIWMMNDLGFDLPVIDMQHLWLVYLITQMEHSLQQSSKITDFNQYFRLAVQFAEKHFKDEEKILEQIGYPNIEKHIEEHRRFTGHLAKLEKASANFNLEQCAKLYRFLRGWLFGHIGKEDRDYVRYALQRGIKADITKETAIHNELTELPEAQFYAELIEKFPEHGADKKLIENTAKIIKTNKLVTGVPLMDLQHVWLVRLVLEMEAVHDDDDDERRAILLKTIQQAQEYVNVHFSAEEYLLEKLEFPDYKAHKQRHVSFKEMLVVRKKEAETGNIRAAWALVRNLKEWLYSHIVIEDMNYAKICREKPELASGISREMMKDLKLTPKKNQLEFYRAVLRTLKTGKNI